MGNIRDDNYLYGRLDQIWDRYFFDVEQKNDVRIIFGRKARTRLGSIKQLAINRKQLTGKLPVNSTIITINGLFKNPDIPEFLVDSVIAHEMVHYAHGFCSPHEKKYDNPHAGGIIKKEMKERGLDDLFFLQKKWLKANWNGFLKENYPQKTRIRMKRKARFIKIF